MTLQCSACSLKGKTFGLMIRKTDARIIPRAVVAPVEEAIGRPEQPNPAPAAQEAEAAPRPEETEGVRIEREARDLAATLQSSRQLGQSLGEGGLSNGSSVEDMRNRLRALGPLV